MVGKLQKLFRRSKAVAAGEEYARSPDCGTFCAEEALKALGIQERENPTGSKCFYTFQYRAYDCELVWQKINARYSLDVGMIIPGTSRMFAVNVEHFCTAVEAKAFLSDRKSRAMLEECLKILVYRVQNE